MSRFVLPLAFSILSVHAGWTQEPREQYFTNSPEKTEIYVKMVSSLSPVAGELPVSSSPRA